MEQKELLVSNGCALDYSIEVEADSGKIEAGRPIVGEYG
jgi:hypothetical protein